MPTLHVPNINDEACQAFIRTQRPDILAVCGTGVIRAEVFALAPKGAVNIHTGITPEYRSADPIFWALYHSDLENVGVTIHYIDSGIDTGAIIYQERVPVYAGDSLEAISARCIRRGAELYVRALEDIANGTVQTISKPGVVGRAFRSIDLGLVQYLAYRVRFWRLSASLPRCEETDRAAAVEATR